MNYDYDKFFAISGHRYTGTTEPIAAPLGYAQTGKEKFGLDSYANKRGFYTMLSFLSAEDDFAEIISSTLTSTPKEVFDAGFVNEYVQKNWHINLKQMQVISVRRINAYLKQH